MGTPTTSDPAKKPRRPRARTSTRAVAKIGNVAQFSAVHPVPLSQDFIELIVAELPSNCDPLWLEYRLEEIAGTYLRQREQPQTSRAEAGAQLEMIAFICGELVSGPSERSEIDRALQPLFEKLCQEARIAIWCVMSVQLHITPDQARERLRSDTIDPAFLRNIALIARAGTKQPGDYNDNTLDIAVTDLIDAYEKATGKTATWSRKGVGAISGEGTMQEIVGSACGRFVLKFFEQLPSDEQLTETRISYLLQKILHDRRKSGQSFPLPEAQI